ncbi:MAG: MATE family efflux transporter [Clostridia bacterium]|nr:MATE family efflux transporter [Clostridia bacterium]
MGAFARLIEPRQQLGDERKTFDNKALKAMIIPLVIENVLQMVVGLADTMMASHAGEGVLTGVGLDNLIITVFLYLFTAPSAGGAVVVSQYIGSRDGKNASLSASQIFHIAGLLSLVCMALTLAFGPALIDAVFAAKSEAVRSACKTYLWIVALSFPATAVYNAGAAVFRAMGQTRITMWVTLAGNIVNVAGNAIGVFALHAGAPGVAWPTVISWYLNAAVMTWLCLGTPKAERLLERLKAARKARVTIVPKDVLRLHPSMAGRILGVAIPNSIESTLFQASKVVISFMLLASLPDMHIDANTTGQTFWSLAACMGTAMSTVFITVIGQCVGAGDQEAAAWYMRKLTRLSVALAVIWNAAVMALTPMLLPLYDLSAETKTLILIVVAIHNFFSATVQPFAMPLSSGLRAAGDIKFTMWASIFCTVVCRTLLSFLLVRWLDLGLGVIGIAIAMALDWCIKAVLDIVRFRSGKWKNRKVI